MFWGRPRVSYSLTDIQTAWSKKKKGSCWSITAGSQGRHLYLTTTVPYQTSRLNQIARLLTSAATDMDRRVRPCGQWKETGLAQRKVAAEKYSLLVNYVFDVVMHALVRPSFVWLYVKGHLCKTHLNTNVNRKIIKGTRQIQAWKTWGLLLIIPVCYLFWWTASTKATSN